MAEPRMPTTLPSPVDRTEFRFAAVDAVGTTWEWVDQEMVWVQVAEVADPDGGARDGCLTLH